jgi:hypothetical protein
MFVWRVIVDFLKDKDYRELLITTIIILGVGTIAFHLIEGWRLIDALYFCIVTLTTIGYGDLYPKTDLGKVFNMFYILIGLGLILSFIKTVYDHYDNTKRKIREKK